MVPNRFRSIHNAKYFHIYIYSTYFHINIYSKYFHIYIYSKYFHIYIFSKYFHIYVYSKYFSHPFRAQVVGNGFCSSVVEHWSSNAGDAGSIPSRKALELHFFFATGPGLGLIMYILTTLEFPKHHFEFHLLTTSVNAKYYYIYSTYFHIYIYSKYFHDNV